MNEEMKEREYLPNDHAVTETVHSDVWNGIPKSTHVWRQEGNKLICHAPQHHHASLINRVLTEEEMKQLNS